MKTFRAPIALAVSCLLAPLAASAADLTVPAFGGTWEQAYRKCFVQPFEKATGKSVSVVLGNPNQWINQVAASPSKPPLDIIVGSIENIKQAQARGLLDPIGPDNVPNVKDYEPKLLALGGGASIPLSNGLLGLMYNKAKVPNPPKTWKEFTDGVIAGKYKAMIPGISYIATPAGVIAMLTLSHGGDLNNVQPTLDLIKKMRESGNLKFFTDINAPLAALRSGEADVAMYFDGRAWAEHDTNNKNISYLNPAPGAVPFPSMMMKVKGASPLALQFLNTVSSVEGQSCFANTMQYAVANTKVTYGDTLKSRIASDSETMWLNFDEVLKHTPQWIEMWNKQIGR
jgi:putative spermidine/putrescine transport system substrate-binding protein